jgi:hypothetical protein
MASLPKKVFEHFSRGIIHKNEIYVYLFMTFTIDNKEINKVVYVGSYPLLILLRIASGSRMTDSEGP